MDSQYSNELQDGITTNSAAMNEGKETQCLPPKGLVLKKALVAFRHGARTPLFTTPNIPQATYEAEELMVDMAEIGYAYDVINAQSKGPRPFSNAEAHYAGLVLKGGCVSGQLTLLGQQQMYNLGQVLKKDYVDHHKLIDQVYNKDQLFLKSTNINRTIKSLCCVLAGLFELESLKSLPPVQIPVSDESNEVMIPNTVLCPNLQIYYLRAQNNANLESGTLHDRLLVEKCIGIDSTNLKNRLKWVELRDDIVARQAHNFEIPKELEPHVEMICKNATMELYHSLSGQTDQRRRNPSKLRQFLCLSQSRVFLFGSWIFSTLKTDLVSDSALVGRKDNLTACMLSCGKLIHMFLEHLKMDTDDGNHRLYLYSCHDSTLMALLGAIGIFDNKWPPFAADLRIELYEDSESQQFIKVSYLNKNMISRGCDEIYTPFETFVKGMSPMAVDTDSYAAACCCQEIEKIAQENDVINEDAKKETKAIGL